MSRKIKFRAWDKHEEEMIYPQFWIQSKGGGQPCVKLDDGHFGYHGSSMELLQYTGLKDKSGVEIYEGDCITNHGRTNDMKLRTYQIYWSTQQARFSAKDDRAKSSTAIDDFSMEQCEVIGNIYENPGLLTGEIQES